MPRKKISNAIKQKVIEAGARKLSRREIAEEFGISISSVNRILKEKSAENAPERLTANEAKTERQQRIEDLERRIAELEKRLLKAENR
jgi:transcriptional regulator with XRE-family HTH domain